ncbi:hypothetical protein SPFM7_00004 [Salmonella phage SPFM7]|nr:hypothetical protein SPFM7_00004 [Salmonella phage SPFM7]
MSLLEIFLMYDARLPSQAVDAIDPDALVSVITDQIFYYAATFEKGDDVEFWQFDSDFKDTESDAKLFSFRRGVKPGLLTVTRCKRAAITRTDGEIYGVPTYDGPYPFKSQASANRALNFKSPVVYRSKALDALGDQNLVGTDVKVEYTMFTEGNRLCSMLSRRVQGQLAHYKVSPADVDCTEFGYVLRTQGNHTFLAIEANDVTYRLEPVRRMDARIGEVFEAIKHRSRDVSISQFLRPTKPLPFQVNVIEPAILEANDPSEDDPWLRSMTVTTMGQLYSTATIPQNLSRWLTHWLSSMNTVLARLLADAGIMGTVIVICEMVQVGGLPILRNGKYDLRTGQIHSAQQVKMWVLPHGT